MGLEPSSSGRWGPPQPISLPGSHREYQNVDYHKNNLRNLRKQSKRNGEDKGNMDGMDDGRRSRPMRALPPDPRTLMEANKKRYEHVQSKVSAWASTTSIPDSLASTPKSPKKVRANFLRSHAKTGPFLPPSRLIARDAEIDPDVPNTMSGRPDVSSEMKPLGEVKYSKSLRNISVGDSATLPRGFKGRIHANIPPLSLGSGGEENHYTGDEEDNCDEEDMSIPFGGTAAGSAEYRGHSAKSGHTSISFSRFSEISIEDRKERISAMVTEIYSTVPMSRAHYGQGGRSLHDSMKKYASMDHVSDVGSVITAVPPRMVNGNVPLPHGGGAMGSARPGMSPSLHRRFVSSPKLTQPIVTSKNPFNTSPPSSAAVNKSSRTSTQSFGKGSTGMAKTSSASSASNIIRREQRQKAELYGTLPKRKTQSQSNKPGRELPKTPTERKSSLAKENKPEKKNSRTKSVDTTSSFKKISQSSVQDNEDVKQDTQDEDNIQTAADDVVEKGNEDVRSVASSRKSSTVVDLDDVPVPASLSRQDDKPSKHNSRSTSPGANMDRDSLSPDPKEFYKFTHDRDTVVNHTGKVFEHMDIVRHGYNAFFSIHKTNPFDAPAPKQDKDENFNNIQAEADKIVDSLENTREKTPSVIDGGRQSQSRATSIAESNHTQNRSRSVSVAESNVQGQSRAPSTIEADGQTHSRTTSVVETRRSQTPQKSISQISGVNDDAAGNVAESRTESRRSQMSPMRSQGENRRSNTPSSQRFISPSRSMDLREEDDISVIKGTDIDYVLANADLVEQAGHQRRKASKERKDSESRSSKLSGLADPLPQDHEKGTVPRYLLERREKWKKEAEQAEKARKESEGCPTGHVKLSDSERRVALHKMKDEYKDICAEMARFPIRSDTLRVRQRRIELEKELIRLEDGIKTYEKEKVYVLKDNAATIESSVAEEKQDFEPTLG